MADHEAVAEMIGAMEAAGVCPIEPIAQQLAGGELVRFRCEGDKPSRRNGWAILYLDGRPAGAFGNYRMGLRDRWRSGTFTRLSSVQLRARRRAMAAQSAKRAAERDARHQDAANRALALWEGACAPDPAHPYLARKEMDGEGLRQTGRTLLVPMRDIGGELWNVQHIFADGVKLFLKGGRTDGLMWLCGEPDAVICIGEGVSTLAAVRRATGHAVVASFSEKNLLPVARAVHARWPALDKVVCADDDAHLIDHPAIRRNLGLEAAHAAALAIGGRLATPPRGQE
jgi:putative DNA primase/helicase